MIGIVFATHREAKPFLSRIHANPIQTGTATCYDAGVLDRDLLITVISGMGKVAAAISSSYVVNAYGATTLISAGLCGLLHRRNGGNVGDLFKVDSAVEGDCDRFGESERPVSCDTRWFSQMRPARLVTCDRPVFDSEKRLELGEAGDLVDMEGAAVARVADFYGTHCAMIKGVSDVADEGGRNDIAANMDWVSGRIAKALLENLY